MRVKTSGRSAGMQHGGMLVDTFICLTLVVLVVLVAYRFYNAEFNQAITVAMTALQRLVTA